VDVAKECLKRSINKPKQGKWRRAKINLLRPPKGVSRITQGEGGGGGKISKGFAVEQGSMSQKAHDHADSSKLLKTRKKQDVRFY